MAEKDKDKKNECFNCGSTSEHRCLFPCEYNGEPKWICARCIPIMIHGPH